MRRIVWAVLFLAVAVLFAWPTFRYQWILFEHRSLPLQADPTRFAGALLADWRQLHDPLLGPRLLRDSEVVQHRLEQLSQGGHEALIRDRGEWALMFAALRLQRLSDEQISSLPQGLDLCVATLAAEADPPVWWGECDWIAEELATQPRGSFHLGLLTPGEVGALVEAAPMLSERQLPALVDAVLRHTDGFSRADRRHVLEAWEVQQSRYFCKRNRPCVQAMLQRRDELIGLAEVYAGPGRTLAVDVIPPPELDEGLQSDVTAAVHDFLRSCGYVVQPGHALPIETSLESVDGQPALVLVVGGQRLEPLPYGEPPMQATDWLGQLDLSTDQRDERALYLRETALLPWRYGLNCP